MTLDQFREGVRRCQADGKPEDVVWILGHVFHDAGYSSIEQLTDPDENDYLWGAFQKALQLHSPRIL